VAGGPDCGRRCGLWPAVRTVAGGPDCGRRSGLWPSVSTDPPPPGTLLSMVQAWRAMRVRRGILVLVKAGQVGRDPR
jgi:hypothetical protein